MRSILISACVFALAPSLALGQQSLDIQSFHSCVDREAPTVVDEAIGRDPAGALYGYPTEMENEVIHRCGDVIAPATLADAVDTAHESHELAYVDAAVQAEIFARRTIQETKKAVAAQAREAIEARKEADERKRIADAMGIYSKCVITHAKTLSLVSSETADVIAEAAVPFCDSQRRALFDQIKDQNGEPVASKTLTDIDSGLHQTVVLEVIKARAINSLPPPPSVPNGAL